MKNISSGLFWQLLGAMKRTGTKAAVERMDKGMPVLLLSGQDDPVGDQGKGVAAVKAMMEKAGLKRVQMELLPGARHVVLDEKACGAADAAKRMIAEFLLG